MAKKNALITTEYNPTWGAAEKGWWATFQGSLFGPCKTRDAAYSRARVALKKFRASQGAQSLWVSTATPAAVKTSKLVVSDKVNYISFIIDKSGSMSSLIREAIKALNENIETIKSESNKNNQKTFISVYSFNGAYDCIRHQIESSYFKPIGENEIYVGGNTALLDTVGYALELQESNYTGAASKSNVDTSYVVMAITDGEENASRRWNKFSLSEFIRRLQATDRWTITLLVPPHRGSAIAKSLNVPEGNVREWFATTQGIREYAAVNRESFGAFYSARSAGKSSVKTFYTDLSNVSKKDIAKNLVEANHLFDMAIVPVTQDIQRFVKNFKGYYNAGDAYYQLTKTENLVQKYKDIVVYEGATGKLYAGVHARAVLGIPNEDLKIKPGNHSGYEIYIQSTSLNRKLIAGSKIVIKR